MGQKLLVPKVHPELPLNISAESQFGDLLLSQIHL